jgi:hypothetical protein
VVEASAKARINLEKLLEAILLQAELLELRAAPARSAAGVVVEARLDRGRGPVATLLVQRGRLRAGDAVVAGCQWGRVRALTNQRGEQLEQAGPSTPAEVLGLSGTPNPGDCFAVVESEARARAISQARHAAYLAGSGRRTLADMLARIKTGDTKELPIVIKADVHGSLGDQRADRHAENEGKDRQSSAEIDDTHDEVLQKTGLAGLALEDEIDAHEADDRPRQMHPPEQLRGYDQKRTGVVCAIAFEFVRRDVVADQNHGHDQEERDLDDEARVRATGGNQMPDDDAGEADEIQLHEWRRKERVK